MEKVPDTFDEYLDNVAADEYSSLFTFCVKTLIFSVKVNIWHWTTDAGFKHEQLNKIYSILRDFPDTLTEVGIGNSKFNMEPIDAKIEYSEYNDDTVISGLEEFRNDILTIQDGFKDNVAIDTLFGDFLKEYDHEVSLLKNYK